MFIEQYVQYFLKNKPWAIIYGRFFQKSCAVKCAVELKKSAKNCPQIAHNVIFFNITLAKFCIFY
jgi:hypothetical protein